MYNAIYNSRNLGTGDYQITKIDVPMPKTKVNKYELVQADGQIVTARYFGERTISVAGRILADSLDDMQTKLDTLKTYTIGYEKYLDITIGTSQRRYTATVTNFNYKTSGYYCEWTIDFSCDSFGYDFASTALTFGTFTSSPTSYANTIAGTYFTEPSFDSTVNRVDNWWSAKYIEIKNSVLNQRMRITRVWSPGDRVVINGRTKTSQIYPSTTTVVDNCDVITGWTSANTLSLETALMKQGVGCHKIVMASATATSYDQRLNATAIDLSSTAGYVLIPVFIPTPTSGTVASVDFTIGSGTTFASNFCYWRTTTQWDGSAIASNAWNYFRVDLSVAPTGTTGTPVRTAIISIQVLLNATATMQLNGWLVDYISTYQVGSTLSALDYEGTPPALDTGSQSLTFTDEFTTRNVTITGSYTKRYL
jgi:hypothetical protein